jgi:hypothetical protein
MIISIKTFHKLQIFAILLTFSISCGSKNPDLIEQNQLIELYARLLIINEMAIEKDQQDSLVENLMHSFQVTNEDLEKTLNYYNDHPEEWVPILNKIRERIKEIKSKGREEKTL